MKSSSIVKVDERLKGEWPGIDKEIKLCPNSVSILHIQSPVIIFLLGRDSETDYWVPVQAYDTSFEDRSKRSYEIYFTQGQKTYILDEIRKAIKVN